MFEDSLTESPKGFEGLRRAGATILLLALQVAIVAGVIVIPIWHTQALSAQQLTLTTGPYQPIGDPVPPIPDRDREGQVLDDSVCEALDIIARTNSLRAPGNGLRRPYGCWPATPANFPVVTSEGILVNRVVPVYPTLAKTARIQGHVVFEVIIGKDGRIKNLRVLSGHPMLVYAAHEAVRQWRYRPYVLNNEPVEVETRIDVNFELSSEK